MIRTKFREILKDMVSERFDDEVEAYNYFVNSMRGYGYVISSNDFYILSIRGGLQMERLNRIQNYYKPFKVNQIRNTLKDVYDYIKEHNQ